MNQELVQLHKEFEQEVWLYLDEELPDERLQFWNKKLIEFPELNKYVKDYHNISALYSSASKHDIDESKFDLMIDKAVNNNNSWGNIKTYFLNLFSSDSEFVFQKIAFASFLIVVATVVSLTSNRNHPVVKVTEVINAELLDWDAEFVDNQIGKVGKLLRVAQDEEYRKYYKYKVTATSVEKNINNINANIELLKKDINNKNL